MHRESGPIIPKEPKGSALTPSLVWHQNLSSPLALTSGSATCTPRLPPMASQMCWVPGWHFS